MVEKREKIGEFAFLNIGGNHILIYPHPTVHTYSAIAMTGSDVKKFIEIHYLHRIIKLVLIHLTSAYAKSYDSLKAILELEAGKSIISPKFTDLLFEETSIVDAEFIEPFGQEFEYEPRTWTLTLNSTSGDVVIPVLYIQKIGGS